MATTTSTSLRQAINSRAASSGYSPRTSAVGTWLCEITTVGSAWSRQRSSMNSGMMSRPIRTTSGRSSATSRSNTGRIACLVRSRKASLGAEKLERNSETNHSTVSSGRFHCRPVRTSPSRGAGASVITRTRWPSAASRGNSWALKIGPP